MLQIPGLFIMETPNRGKGVFAGLPISEGDSIEVCHIVKIAKAEIPIIHKTSLHDYYFLWGEDLEEAALALGFGSLYNHQLFPNANFFLDLENETIDIVAIRDIEPGEEITINYHGEPGDEGEVWFEVGWDNYQIGAFLKDRNKKFIAFIQKLAAKYGKK